MKSTVLHVSEAFSGGVISAVAHFARLTSTQFESILVARRRGAHDTGDELGAFAEIVEHTGDLLSFARLIRRVTHDRRPAVVHLHSTWAGTLGRIALPARRRIVYSPHCFAFERRDLGLFTRAASLLVEKALAPFQGGFAAIGAYEADLAGRLVPRSRVWVVPNSVELGFGKVSVAAHLRRQRRTVAMVGRAAAQKGVRFFIKTVRLLDPGRFRALWIGGGDPAGEAELRAAGVVVTGWLPREQVLATLCEEVDIYFHTARWEGTPVTLLEAAALQLPIVARRIPHLVDVPVTCWAESPAVAARSLTQLLDATAAERVRSANEAILARFSAQRTQEALLDAYRSVVAAREEAAVQARLRAGGGLRRRAS